MRLTVLGATVLGFAFGAADQYLGSRIALGVWAATVSVMSAPWLVLPFLAGALRGRRGEAAVLGAVVTAAALAGYFALTLSPLEGVPLSRFPGGLVALLRGGQIDYVVAGAVTGPLFGLLGHAWWAGGSRVSGAAVAAALCLEPLVRAADGSLFPPATVWWLEAACGIAAATAFLTLPDSGCRATSGTGRGGPGRSRPAGRRPR